MGLNYSKSPIEENVNTEWSDDNSPPWLTTLKDIFSSASRIICMLARGTYHLLRGVFYGGYYLLQGLYHVFKGVFYSVQGLVYFLVGFFGKQGTAIILTSMAVLAAGYYVYTKDPNFAHQHVQLVESNKYIEKAGSKMGDMVNKTSENMSTKIGDLSSKVGEFVNKGKNDIWTKFDWTSK